ncbi:hypothetical protein N7499_008843 [Penicillium canescens]|nr:hypothetical protein N7522_006877 [Penicillium canescens]KAJ6076862.1 hypothetical protein N7499_008843 [Penicillium canescens]KAJ6159170.1 hypothetical protein N7485_011996 [Penicillium canescens]
MPNTSPKDWIFFVSPNTTRHIEFREVLIMSNLFSCIAPRASASTPQVTNSWIENVDANEFDDRRFLRTHKITGEEISNTGSTYTIQQEETRYLGEGKSIKRSHEIKLSLSELVCDEDGLQLLRDWYPKRRLKNGNFRYTHQIVDQMDSPEGKVYKVERKIDHFDSKWILVEQTKEGFLAPVQTILRCEAGGVLLTQWETLSPSNV